jgi:serine/threonine protein kinase
VQQVARLLNDTYDPDDAKHIVRLMDCFPAHNHLCLVFELLSINIYELLKTNQFRGLPLPMIRSFTKQVCIHCYAESCTSTAVASGLASMCFQLHIAISDISAHCTEE